MDITTKQHIISLVNKVLADDIDLNTSRGIIKNRKSINAVGRVEGVGSTERVIGGVNPFLGFLTTADTLRISSGGDSDDDVSGLGVRAVELFGLDQDFNMVIETVITSGVNASLSTTANFIRLFTARAVPNGTYSTGLNGSNAGIITIETTGGISMERMLEGDGITQSSMRTIPAGFTGFIVSLSGQVDGDKTGTITIWGRRDADIVVAPFGSRIQLGGIPNIVGRQSKPLKTFPPIPEKTDIWATAIKTGGGTTMAGVDYQLILIKDNED